MFRGTISGWSKFFMTATNGLVAHITAKKWYAYPVLYMLRFYVANVTILARILRCYPIFAKKALRRPPALTRLTSFPGIAINWTI